MKTITRTQIYLPMAGMILTGVLGSVTASLGPPAGPASVLVVVAVVGVIIVGRPAACQIHD